jgi:hypothetical protein
VTSLPGAQAFYLASTGRPGPVLVDVPKDVQQQLAVPDWDVPMAIAGYMARLPPAPAPFQLAPVVDALHAVRARARWRTARVVERQPSDWVLHAMACALGSVTHGERDQVSKVGPAWWSTERFCRCAGSCSAPFSSIRGGAVRVQCAHAKLHPGAGPGPARGADRGAVTACMAAVAETRRPSCTA